MQGEGKKSWWKGDEENKLKIWEGTEEWNYVTIFVKEGEEGKEEVGEK